MEVAFAPSFIRALKALPLELQEEALEKIDAFQDIQNHKQLRVHALTGRLDGRFSFSVNFKTRIVFQFSSRKPKTAYLLMIGNHSIYQ
ncbi:hypothetical protein KBC54_04020 [Patescibacteria group bacterium]|nr:hypothetical protein [Patescibacteria group bacterium]